MSRADVPQGKAISESLLFVIFEASAFVV